MGIVKIVGLVILLSAVSGLAQTNLPPPYCSRYPMRGFGGATVNLTPLIQWWVNQPTNQPANQPIDDSTRPLAAWKRVVGLKVSDMGLWWVVDAEIFTNEYKGFPARIVLKNPPNQDEQVFYALQQQIADQQAQLNSDQATIQNYQKAAQTNDNYVNADTASHSWQRRWYADIHSQRASNDKAMAAEVQPLAIQEKQALDATQAQLNAMPSFQGHYQIDLFALATGQVIDGLPVYDLGVLYSP